MKRKATKLGAMLMIVLLLTAVFTPAAMAANDSLPDTTSERVLHLYKYAPSEASDPAGDGTRQTITGKEAMANVRFEIWRTPANFAPTGQSPTSTEITTITGATANYVTTIVTDATGYASYTFARTSTDKSVDDGVYLIREVTNTAVQTAADPFYLIVPLTNTTENGFLYNMYVYPKNTIKPGPSIDKDVRAIGDKDQGYNVGTVFPYILRGGVPDDLFQANGTGTADDVYAGSYAISDTLNGQLTYRGGIRVTVLQKNGTELTTALSATTDYTTTGTSAVDVAGGTVNVQLTKAGMKFIAENLGTGTGTPEIRVYFNASINATATMGADIPNNATLSYTNSTGHAYADVEVADANRPNVHTGGFHLQKTETDQKTLITASNATFQVASSEANALAGNYLKVIALTGEIVDVGHAGYNTANALSITTANGLALLNGLAYQKDSVDPAAGQYYWLVETAAPSGYNLLTKPTRITVNAGSHLADSVITVINTKKFILPTTGGSGTVWFTIGGLLLIGAAGATLLIAKKRKATEK